MHEVLVNRLGGLSLPWKSVVRLTDRPDMTLDVYRERKTTIQHNQITLCRGSNGPIQSRNYVYLLVFNVCISILVTTFPEWLSGTEPLSHTPGAVRPSLLCV